MNDQQMPSTSGLQQQQQQQQPVTDIQRGRANIPHEIYQKIREVDQQSSTLTAHGVQGMSARVVETYVLCNFVFSLCVCTCIPRIYYVR